VRGRIAVQFSFLVPKSALPYSRSLMRRWETVSAAGGNGVMKDIINKESPPGGSGRKEPDATDTSPTRLETLERLYDLGIHIARVQPGAALGSDIEDTGKIAREDLESVFSGVNVAAAWGAKSGGVVNVAFPSEEARRLAPNLPETGLVFGPDDASDTNRVYLLEEKIKIPIVFGDTTVPGSPVLAELRGDGASDLVPPSRTPEGMDIKFSNCDEPARVNLHDLLGETSRIAAATLIVRHLQPDQLDQVGIGLRRYLKELGIDPATALDVCWLVGNAIGGAEGEAIYAQAQECDATPTDSGQQLSRCVGGREVVDLFKEFLTVVVTPPTSEAARPSGSGRKQVDDVLALAGDLELFHTPHGEAYASLPVEGETHAIGRGGALGRLLQTRYYGMFGSAAAPTSINTAIDTLEAMALLGNARCISVYTRVAGDGDKVYIDLTNEGWEVVEIDHEGWCRGAMGIAAGVGAHRPVFRALRCIRARTRRPTFAPG
jgi:hypothetical protein